MNPPLSDICNRGGIILKFCCSTQITRAEIGSQYEQELRRFCNNCTCTADFLIQYPTKRLLIDYVQQSRRQSVSSQGCKIRHIQTSCGTKSSCVFRFVMSRMVSEFKNTGGPSTILPYKHEYENWNHI